MEIVCPQCAYFKDMDPGLFPPEAKSATCPKCGHGFDLPAPGPPLETPKSDPLTVVCPYCGFSKDVDRAMLPHGAGEAVCPRCRRRFRLTGEDLVTDRPAGVPWEDDGGPPLGRWWKTTKRAWFNPGDLYGRLTLDGDGRIPLIYGLICGSAGFAFILLWVWTWVILAMVFDPWSVRGLSFGAFSLVMLALMVFSPLWALIGLFVWSGPQHLFLLIVKGGRAGFGATFRVCCYASAGMVWSVIPFIGPAVGLVWSLVLSINGLARVHGIGPWRIVLAVFVLPAVAAILLLVLLVLAVAFFLGVF